MSQKLTDLWPLLLQQTSVEPRAAPSQPQQSRKNQAIQISELDQEELKRARWTGVISVQGSTNDNLPAPVLILDDLAEVVA